MNPLRLQTLVIRFLLAAGLLGSLSLSESRPVRAQVHASAPAAVQDAPVALIASGVSSYALVSPQYKIFWHTARPACPPNSPQRLADDAERVSRIPKDGGPTRVLYQLAGCGAGQVLSNIVADENYIYWTTANGLVRLSVNANPGDASELVNGLMAGSAELAVDGTNLFVLLFDSNTYGTLYRVGKSNGTAIWMTGAGQNANNLQTSYSFTGGVQRYFVYWLVGGQLQRFNVDTLATTPLASGVTGYFAEGGRSDCSISCFFSDLVFFGTGTQVRQYNNLTGATSNPVYTSTDGTASVFNLTADANNLFVFEHRDVSCLPFTCYDNVLVRTGRGNDSGQVPIYNTGGLSGLLGPARLTTDGEYLYWQENQNGSLQRLPNDASALSQINMSVTGLEITQGIQKPDNSVRLIQNKRTFVRVFVKADAAWVPGVTASLEGYVDGAPLGVVFPVNNTGTKITVSSLPWRSVMDMSFLFELPWSWTTAGSLTLVAHLNPYHAQLEPNYADNDLTSGPFTFSASPRLQVQFIAWGYNWNNQIIYPRYTNDILQTYSWIRRAYPLASTPGFSTDLSPGFRPGLWYVLDATLSARVLQIHADCAHLLVLNQDNSVKSDNRNLCASEYTNQRMAALRAENGLPENLFFYGMISDAAAFPRGQACCGAAVSSGPVGSGDYGWDFDGSYGDWYAAHEIGHTLGRGHPSQGNSCGHSASDPNYPHADATIGATDDTEGFDFGDPALGIARALYAGLVWHDVMSYCNNQWVSDYTYEGMYNGASLQMLAPTNKLGTALALPKLSGDWLLVQGDIISGTPTARLTHLKRLPSVVSLPPLVAGGYSIQLLNGSNSLLANYAFTPEVIDEAPDLLGFTQVVTFTAGTAQVRLVRNSDNMVLTVAPVSAHAPTVSNVALQGAPNPVTGTVTLGWIANDQDGNALTFDVFYSRDGGATLQPLAVNVGGQSMQLDTARLGGGTAILRVVASDGVNTARADSAPFTVANKPPLPRILTPNDGLHIHYGQLVNLSGEAEDAQDGGVSGIGLAWSYQNGMLGTGPLLSVDDLPVGPNLITLTATNSLGLSAAVSLTVTVDDDLIPPGPTLAAGPTQFAWSFPEDATTPMTETLNINNAGGGTLNWTATSDVPWLTLNTTSGTAPASLTLTAQPSGIPNGSALSGYLTLTSSAVGNQPTQTIIVPVGLTVGFSFTHPDDYQPVYLYLPLIRR